MLYPIFKKAAFSLPPELAHDLTISTLHQFPSLCASPFKLTTDHRLSINTPLGLWNFPVGIAAGLDKNARLINFFDQLGVGALEVGTVTPLPQAGNPKPRLFRLIEDESILNRMGFNGPGADVVKENIQQSVRKKMILGINLGKNKVTPNDEAIDDYVKLAKKFNGHGDYFVVNISSPNTPGLRDLQNVEFLKELHAEISPLLDRPCLVKVAPDMDDQQITDLVHQILTLGFDGVIGTNTTNMPGIGVGGVSGKLLREKGRDVRKKILNVCGDDHFMIGVGGISTIEDLWNFWCDGGKVCQIYTSFIFEGPQLFKTMQSEIINLIERFKVQNLGELIELAKKEKPTI